MNKRFLFKFFFFSFPTFQSNEDKHHSLGDFLFLPSPTFEGRLTMVSFEVLHPLTHTYEAIFFFLLWTVSFGSFFLFFIWGISNCCCPEGLSCSCFFSSFSSVFGYVQHFSNLTLTVLVLSKSDFSSTQCSWNLTLQYWYSLKRCDRSIYFLFVTTACFQVKTGNSNKQKINWSIK